MKPRTLRIAFLTPEFVTELTNAGGLASYLARMTKALKDAGHEPEIFVISRNTPEVIEHDGIRIQRVFPHEPWWLTQLARFTWKIFRIHPFSLVPGFRHIIPRVHESYALNKTMEARHRINPFDFVQSSDYEAVGLFVKKTDTRPHLIRCSWARDLFVSVDRIDDPNSGGRAFYRKVMPLLELYALRQATEVYAPSQFVAEYYSKNYNLDLKVIRPPYFIEEQEKGSLPAGIPPRYLLHFGQLGKRKGTDVIAAALPLVWREEPEFAMVWAGKEMVKGVYQNYSQDWGSNERLVNWVGPVDRAALYELIKQAEASVLPSRVDNLPNTVLESLLLGTPVIGSDGASIDEIVEPYVLGLLAPIGDASALAELMLQVWRGEIEWKDTSNHSPPILRHMEPETAVRSLLCLAGFSDSEKIASDAPCSYPT